MTKKEKRNIRQEVTDKIVDALESGTAPWVKPWSSTDGATGWPSTLVALRYAAKYGWLAGHTHWVTHQIRDQADDRWYV